MLPLRLSLMCGRLDSIDDSHKPKVAERSL